jgi:hypothetical protein
MNDCCTSARPHPLPASPSINLFDQLRLDPDVDVCGFALHTGEMGRVGGTRLIIPASKLITHNRSSRTSQSEPGLMPVWRH